LAAAWGGGRGTRKMTRGEAGVARVTLGRVSLLGLVGGTQRDDLDGVESRE